jgi:hypothetical protein
VERERDAAAAAFIQLFSDWLVTRSVVRSKLAAYFPSQDLGAAWEQYANHITYYVRLASSTITMKSKGASVAFIAKFLGESSDTWQDLVKDPRLLSEGEYAEYVKADGLLSNRLLLEKNDLVSRILNSQVAGYSTDMGDLLKDITPFYG